MNRTFMRILAGIPLLVLLSCSTTSTRIASSWKAQGQARILQKVLVIGVANSHATRTMFESEFAERLNSQGVEAHPSYVIFASTGIPDRAAIAGVIKERGIDTVLITRLVDQKDVKQYVPPTSYPSAGPSVDTFYGDWYGYYGSISQYSPGYTVENKVVVLQTNIYDAANGMLLWSATSNTTTQGGSTDVIRSFITAMTKKMQKDGLVK